MDDDAELTTFKTRRIGDISVTRILAMAPLTLDPASQRKATKAVVMEEPWRHLNSATPDGQVRGPIQASVIEAGGEVVLVGNHKERHSPLHDKLDGPFLDRLTMAGVAPASLNVVLCTHLHLDHCGWNTRLVGGGLIPTFPNADCLFARVDYEFSRDGQEEAGPATASDADSVTPIIDAGLATIVEGVTLEATPGHCSVVIRSSGQEALIDGDIVHHPLQACRPEICSRIDWDEAMAIETRRRTFGRYAGTRTRLLGTRVADPTGVLVVEHSDTWRVEPA